MGRERPLFLLPDLTGFVGPRSSPNGFKLFSDSIIPSDPGDFCFTDFFRDLHFTNFFDFFDVLHPIDRTHAGLISAPAHPEASRP